MQLKVTVSRGWFVSGIDRLCWAKYLFIWILVHLSWLLVNLFQQVIIVLLCLMMRTSSEKAIISAFVTTRASR